MKILWLINIPLPEVSQLLNETPTPFGGWLVNLAKDLSSQENISLFITFPKLHINNVMKINGEKIQYFAFPNIHMKNSKFVHDNDYLKDLLKQVQPDLVHIFGTEFAHSLSMINACKKLNIKTVVGIQGLVSIISRHYTANLPMNVQKSFTFRDFVKQNNIIQQKKEFEKRGLLEVEALQKTNHIIGRTTWDRACTLQINSAAKYYFCNETLREEFYKHEWKLENCDRYSIFLSQAAYPVKGLHFMLEALPIILTKYPETKLYIAGPDLTASSIKERLKRTSYSIYIKNLIKKNNLEDYVFFTGLLDEKQMCDRYLKSNVFVCPSSIENSPNSLGEAMILGVPCVASNVGGIPDLLTHKKEGFLYQYDAPYMLAYYVSEIFGNESKAISLSNHAREHAKQTHNKEINLNKLIEIYKNISSSN